MKIKTNIRAGISDPPPVSRCVGIRPGGRPILIVSLFNLFQITLEGIKHENQNKHSRWHCIPSPRKSLRWRGRRRKSTTNSSDCDII